MSKITLITGANQGIGLAVATILATKHKHHVLIGARNIGAAQKVASDLESQGAQATPVQLDLDSESSVLSAVQTIKSQFGHLDILINNAGILLDTKDPSMSTHSLFTKTFTTNVIGTAILTESLLPLLRKATKPRIIFVSSRMGSLHQATVKDTPFYATDYKAYDASKAAVNMLALNYARILEDIGGKANTVCPGLVSTNLTGYTGYGTTTEVGATRIVELATMEESPNRTFSDRDGEIAW